MSEGRREGAKISLEARDRQKRVNGKPQTANVFSMAQTSNNRTSEHTISNPPSSPSVAAEACRHAGNLYSIVEDMLTYLFFCISAFIFSFYQDVAHRGSNFRLLAKSEQKIQKNWETESLPFVCVGGRVKHGLRIVEFGCRTDGRRCQSFLYIDFLFGSHHDVKHP